MADDVVIPDNQHIDLGIDITTPGTSIFEQFHKNQKAGEETKPVEIATLSNDDPPPVIIPKAGDPPPKTDPKPAPKAGDPPPTLETDPDKILELAKKNALGDKSNVGKTDEDDDDPNKVKPIVIEPGIFKTLYEHFTSEMGYEPLTDEEGAFDGTEEKFIEFQEKNLNARANDMAEQMIAEAFAKNPANAAAGTDLFRFLLNGGKVADFVQTRADDDFGADYLSTAANDDDKIVRAETIMRRYYKSLNWQDAAIEKNIKTMKASETLVDMADNTLPEFVKMRDQRKAIANQTAEQQSQLQKQKVKEYNTKLFEIIDTAKEIGPFVFRNAKERQEAKEYMFTPTVELSDGRKISQYMADLEKAKASPLFTLHQALSLKNKSIDYSNIKNKAVLAERTALKDKLNQSAEGKKLETPANVSASPNTRKSVTELIDFDDIQFAN